MAMSQMRIECGNAEDETQAVQVYSVNKAGAIIGSNDVVLHEELDVEAMAM